MFHLWIEHAVIMLFKQTTANHYSSSKHNQYSKQKYIRKKTGKATISNPLKGTHVSKKIRQKEVIQIRR